MSGKIGVARQIEKVRQTFVTELDVNKLLPRLLRRRIFTVAEEKKILGPSNPEERTELMLDIISTKDISAFTEFCHTLEECAPKMLTHLALEGIGK